MIDWGWSETLKTCVAMVVIGGVACAFIQGLTRYQLAKAINRLIDKE